MDRDPYEIERSGQLTFFMASLSMEGDPAKVWRLKLHLMMGSIRSCSYHKLQAYQHRTTVDPKYRYVR
jgi:hypothetical protein